MPPPLPFSPPSCSTTGSSFSCLGHHLDGPCHLTAARHHELQSWLVLSAHQWSLQGAMSPTVATGCRVANQPQNYNHVWDLGGHGSLYQSPCRDLWPRAQCRFC